MRWIPRPGIMRVKFWLVLIGFSGLILVACKGVGGLRPNPPNIASNQIISSQPQLVTFAELEEDPTVYQDKLIRVTGTYVTLPVVSCSPFSGPNTSWALVANDLRLDMLGFEGLLNQLALDNLTLTMDGILRRYDGPLGCGKRPPAGVLWYLEALDIVQPNPLVQADTGPSGESPVIPPPFPTGTSLPPEVEGTPEEEPTTGPGTPTRTPSPTTVVGSTASSTPTIAPGGTTSSQNTATATSTPTRTITPSPTQTTTTGGSSATTTPTPSRTPTPGSGSTPLATASPGNGYPVSTNTPYPPPQ